MTVQAYAVVKVRPEWVVETEQLGSKEKFWYRSNEAEPEWLFKYPQPNTGLHWSEKIAAEIAGLMGIRHATVELAVFEGERGSATESFVGRGSELIHGNQVLAGKVLGYDPERRSRNSDHTLANIWRALEGAFATIDERERAKLQFAGYLILDALVGNTDRHHENWGLCASASTVDGRRPLPHPSTTHLLSGGNSQTSARKKAGSGFSMRSGSATTLRGDVAAFSGRTTTIRRQARWSWCDAHLPMILRYSKKSCKGLTFLICSKSVRSSIGSPRIG